MKWISFVDIVDFVEVVVVAVDPEPHGVEGNGAGLNLTPMEMGRESLGLKMGRITNSLEMVVLNYERQFIIWGHETYTALKKQAKNAHIKLHKEKMLLC